MNGLRRAVRGGGRRAAGGREKILTAGCRLPTARCLLGLAIVICAMTVGHARAAEVTAAEIANRRCLNCHGQSHIAGLAPERRLSMVAPGTRAEDPPPTRPGLFLQAGDLGLHSGLACVDCHRTAAELPHPAVLPPADCSSACHQPAREAFDASAHGAALLAGDPDAPNCVTCHGGHQVLPPRDRQSLTHPLNIVQVCGDCHAQHQPPNGVGNGPVATYLDSVHGRAVARGLAVAATCADCHGYHDVRSSEDTGSLVHREHVAQTCGKCHLGIEEIYSQSIHGQRLAEGHPDAPVCSDCHTAHAITRIDVPAFMQDIVAECGDCHNAPRPGRGRSFYDTYRMSYHGQVTRLGSVRAARCSDCHGSHDIRPLSDPLSRLHIDNRLATCQTPDCHPNARASFVDFMAHADHRDRENYPLLYAVWLYFIIMMSFAFGFFGLHSVLWFIRSTIERVKNGPPPDFHAHNSPSPGTPGEGRGEGPPKAIKRFNRVDRINHAFVIISFFGLTITGLPLLYSDKAWATFITGVFGGVHGLGLWHRIFAIILVGNFVVHGAGVIRRVRAYGARRLLLGGDTLLPRWKDVTDCIGMFRWFFKGGQKPKFDRWTYWEKFDYVAEVGGSLIIGVSGFILWFPEFFSAFLPGWIFNVALVVHGYEALLAIGFIFTIHFFNAHLRWEKFPVDDVMFTGRLPEEEFKHERPLEYARMVELGELEAARVAPAPPWYRHFAVAAGILAMAIGTTLVALIILAGLGLV